MAVVGRLRQLSVARHLSESLVQLICDGLVLLLLNHKKVFCFLSSLCRACVGVTCSGCLVEWLPCLPEAYGSFPFQLLGRLLACRPLSGVSGRTFLRTQHEPQPLSKIVPLFLVVFPMFPL